MKTIYIKLFLRFSIAIAFLSAVADRFGLWPKELSAWGNWESFLEYTKVMNPWFPDSLIPLVGGIATFLEIILAILLLIGYKTELAAKISGFLILAFGVSMALTMGVKAPLDYSVFTAAAAAFGLGIIKEKYLEIDIILDKTK